MNNFSEEKIIDFLYNKFPEQIGDDAAIIPFNRNYSYIITKDLLIEDVHFRNSYYSAKKLAYKTLVVNMSDILAMGAVPKYVLLGIAVPGNYHLVLKDFLQSFTEHCRQYNLILIGGDTTKSTDRLNISVTIIGIGSNKKLKFRHTASSEEIICIIGNIGYANLGFLALENKIKELNEFKHNFLMPNLLIKESQWLARQPDVTSMMDISDGLYVDLKKLCTASNIGAEINLDLIKIEPTFEQACSSLKLDSYSAKLSGGEDYSLLITIKRNSVAKLINKFKNSFNTKIQAIGVTNAQNKITYIKNRQEHHLKLSIFSHFGESI